MSIKYVLLEPSDKIATEFGKCKRFFISDNVSKFLSEHQEKQLQIGFVECHHSCPGCEKFLQTESIAIPKRCFVAVRNIEPIEIVSMEEE